MGHELKDPHFGGIFDDTPVLSHIHFGLWEGLLTPQTCWYRANGGLSLPVSKGMRE